MLSLLLASKRFLKKLLNFSEKKFNMENAYLEIKLKFFISSIIISILLNHFQSYHKNVKTFQSY